MTTLEVEEGVVHEPERILLYGAGGSGKTRTAACMPWPFFVDLERGSTRIAHVARPKKPIGSWEEVFAVLGWLRTAPHGYRTVVLDTLDRAESLCWRHLCARDKVASIEQVSKGYGKGYIAAYEEFRRLFSELEALKERREMHVCVIAHEKIETVKNPAGEDYARYSFKVHDKVGSLVYEASDHVFRVTRAITVTKDGFESGNRYRAVGGERRVLLTAGAPTHFAKTRADVPPTIELSWHELACYLAKAGYPRLLRETVRENARRLGRPDVSKGVEALLSQDAPPARLAEANARILRMLGPAVDPGFHALDEARRRAAGGQAQSKPAASPENGASATGTPSGAGDSSVAGDAGRKEDEGDDAGAAEAALSSSN